MMAEAALVSPLFPFVSLLPLPDKSFVPCHGNFIHTRTGVVYALGCHTSCGLNVSTGSKREIADIYYARKVIHSDSFMPVA